MRQAGGLWECLRSDVYDLVFTRNERIATKEGLG